MFLKLTRHGTAGGASEYVYVNTTLIQEIFITANYTWVTAEGKPIPPTRHISVVAGDKQVRGDEYTCITFGPDNVVYVTETPEQILENFR